MGTIITVLLEKNIWKHTIYQNKRYTLSQCAFADQENGLYEWGWHANGKWMLFDLVVFEAGHRGNKDHILEILEYNGPFHYTENDVDERGEEPAYPWKSNKTTIKESYNIDLNKKDIALSFTKNYTVLWSKNIKNRK